MTRKVSIDDAKTQIATLIGEVRSTGEPIIVEEAGDPQVVMVTADEYKRLVNFEQRAWAVVDEIRERNADKDPDEILEDVTRAAESVRQKHFEKRKAPSRS